MRLQSRQRSNQVKEMEQRGSSVAMFGSCSNWKKGKKGLKGEHAVGPWKAVHGLSSVQPILVHFCLLASIEHFALKFVAREAFDLGQVCMTSNGRHSISERPIH